MLYSHFPENRKNYSHGEVGEAAGSQVGFMLPQTHSALSPPRCKVVLEERKERFAMSLIQLGGHNLSLRHLRSSWEWFPMQSIT